METDKLENEINRAFMSMIRKSCRVYLHYDEVRSDLLVCDFLKFEKISRCDGYAYYRFIGRPDCVYFKKDICVFVINNVQYLMNGVAHTGKFYAKSRILSYNDVDVTYYLASDVITDLGFITRSFMVNIPKKKYDIYVDEDRQCSLSSNGRLTKAIR